MCEILAGDGYWVHFIVPDARGAQPFDIIAVKNGEAFAFDCKTASKHWFGYSRLEENQKFAFERWIKCGNSGAMLAVLYQQGIYIIPYKRIEREGYIDLDAEPVWLGGIDIDN